MNIESLRIKNYRTFRDSGEIPIHDLTVMIGENGSGKTSMVDALSLLLGEKNKPQTSDLFNSEEAKIEIEGQFSYSDQKLECYAAGDLITLKYIHDTSTGVAKFYVKGLLYVNNKFNDYENLSAADLKAFVQELGMKPGNNMDRNKEIVRRYIIENNPKTKAGYKEIKLKTINDFLPILQKYSSSDYSSPESIAGKALTTMYRTYFYDIDTSGNETLKSNFSNIKESIEVDLNKKIEENLLNFLSRHMGDINSVKGDFSIDFSKGFSLNNIIIGSSDSRLDNKSIDNLGDGHKKKVALAVMEWDSEQSRNIKGRQLIKAYDEPDANLDFLAQRKVLDTIRTGLGGTEDNVVAIICTHSLALIDRVSARSINQIKINDNSKGSIVTYLDAADDESIAEYLRSVAETGGIRNSSIFYEKVFFVVEGESEENILGTLYKTYKGNYMADDGVVLINLQTNGQWSNALKFLSTNRKNNTVMLLDSDTQESKHRVTKEKLEEAGFDEDFLENNCFFIGGKEFEDVYPDGYLADMANTFFEKENGGTWSEADFKELRSENKFLQAIKQIISRECKTSIGKPEIAQKMGSYFTYNDIENMEAIKGVFDRIKNIIEA